MGRPPSHDEPLDLLFRALAHPGRRRLLILLAEQPGRTLAELVNELSFSRQAVSQHLALMEDAGLITIRWHGREKLHYLNAVALADAFSSFVAPLVDRQAEVLLELRDKLIQPSRKAGRKNRPA